MVVANPPRTRAYDVAILGATGFTGKLACEYLCRTYSASADVKWLVAARDEAKLASLGASLSLEDPSTMRIVDCTDPTAVEALKSSQI